MNFDAGASHIYRKRLNKKILDPGRDRTFHRFGIFFKHANPLGLGAFFF
jgi:hypothetical protein